MLNFEAEDIFKIIMTAKEFLFALPDKVPHTAIEGMNTNFHFIISGEEADDITLNIENGMMKVIEGLEGTPTCKVQTDNHSFVKIVQKEINPMMALFTGKLKISNQAELLKYAKVFGLM